MRILLLASAFAIAACSGSSTPSSTPAPDPVDNSGGSAAAECASDDDCVVSCAVPEQCCDAQLCEPCQQVYTRAELAAIDDWRARSCAGESCPMAKCMAPTEQAVAVCSAGQCEIKLVPVPRD
jgi:hypothetical protein